VNPALRVTHLRKLSLATPKLLITPFGPPLPDDDSAAADTIVGRGLQPKLPDLSKGAVACEPAKETFVVVRRKRGDRTKLGIGHHHCHNPDDAEGVKVGVLAEGPKSQKWENMCGR